MAETKKEDRGQTVRRKRYWFHQKTSVSTEDNDEMRYVRAGRQSRCEYSS